MKKTLLLTLTMILSSGLLTSQTFTGKLGYAVSPLGHTADFSQFAEFLEEVANTCNGGIVFGNGAWRNSVATSGLIPNLQKTVSLLQPESFAYTDMINFAWRSGENLLLNVPEDPTNNWTNDSMKELFLDMLINAADSLQPTYMFIGNETSRYYELDSVDFKNWVEFYNEAYDSIKIHAPNTQVGTVFNYEHLAGTGALTGFTNPHWGAFNAHDKSKIDVLGLTVYPFFHDTLASDIPLTYLDPIFSRWGDKAISITETGWPADSLIGSWKSSPEQQVDFVDRLFEIIEGHNVESVNWLFLHYLLDNTGSDAEKIFKSVSLRDIEGNDQPALARWLSKCNTSTGIEDDFLATNQLKVFPNPSEGEINIQFKEPTPIDGTLSILDLSGRILLKKTMAKNQLTTRLTIEEEGIFFVMYDNGIERITKKIFNRVKK